ncbi:MAG: anthranilate synthase component I family protein [Nitrospirota bacterium]
MLKMVRPSRARFLMAAQPQPLILSVPQPEANVFELYRRIAAPGRPSFLLESGKGGSGVARWSFFGSDPYLELSGKGTRYELRSRDGSVIYKGDPFKALAELLKASRMPRPEDAPPFIGGAVGYFSYDLIRQFEKLPNLATDDLRLPDLLFAFVDLFAAVDHHTKMLHLIYAPPLDQALGRPREKLYSEGCDRLSELHARLMARRKKDESDLRIGHLTIKPDQSRSDYVQRAKQCQDFIRSGDIYQANLSHRLTIDRDPGWPMEHFREHAGVALYSRVREVNPSPFGGLLAFENMTLVSSSPERLVRLDGRRVDTRPIAGTRPRGHTPAEDLPLAEDLITNAKERAEHLMLVDLERNDLGRVCKYGTVRADEFMIIERYSHVSHIVSNVMGELRDGLDGFDLIKAVFPGGTITGVPKIRCMEILEGLEPVRRGPYTGSMGYLSWSGDLDLNIIIRTMLLVGGRGYLQVGAGIVADSDPAKEYEETLYKAEAFFKALGQS